MINFFKKIIGDVMMNGRYIIDKKDSESLKTFSLRLLSHPDMSWEDLMQEHKAFFLVNTATGCGLHQQLALLEDLSQKYSAEKLAVISVPSADFMGQEKRDGADLVEYCRTQYGAQYFITEKIKVKGSKESIHPLFGWLSKAIAPKWNYQKYLFDSTGALRYIYDPRYVDFDQIAKDIAQIIQEDTGA